MGLTIQDMHRLIEQDVQKMGFAAYLDLASEEIDIHINREIKLLLNGILDKHFGRPLKIDQNQGFQENQVTLDNLRTLHIRNWSILPTVVPGQADDEVFHTIPANYYHYIKASTKLFYYCYEDGKRVLKDTTVNIRIEPSQNDSRSNPFRKTGLDSPLAEIAGNSIIVYKLSTFDVTNFKLSYIKKPAIVKYAKDVNGDYDEANSVQCDLDDSLHEMLVNMTSLKIQEIVESPQQKVVNSQRQIV